MTSSRYQIPGLEPQSSVVVGWDDFLDSYFAIVRDPAEESIPALRLGKFWTQRLASVEHLEVAIRDYAELPPEIRVALSLEKTAAY